MPRMRWRPRTPPRTPLGELTTLPQNPYSAGEGNTPPEKPHGASILAPSAFAARHLQCLISSVYPDRIG